MRAIEELFVLVALTAHPSPAPTDGPLKLTDPSRPSFISLHGARETRFSSCIDSTTRAAAARYGSHTLSVPLAPAASLFHTVRARRPRSVPFYRRFVCFHSPYSSSLLSPLASAPLRGPRQSIRIDHLRQGTQATTSLPVSNSRSGFARRPV